MNKNFNNTCHLLPPPSGEGRGGGRSEPKAFARQLRLNATPAERILWQRLRNFKAEGRHIRRQVTIDRFVVDFACHFPKVIIELDGGQHGDAATYDEKRTKILNVHGYQVLRFWNGAVYESLEGVVDRIRYELRLPTAFDYSHLKKDKPNIRSDPHPNPPHKGEGESS